MFQIPPPNKERGHHGGPLRENPGLKSFQLLVGPTCKIPRSTQRSCLGIRQIPKMCQDMFSHKACFTTNIADRGTKKNLDLRRNFGGLKEKHHKNATKWWFNAGLMAVPKSPSTKYIKSKFLKVKSSSSPKKCHKKVTNHLKTTHTQVFWRDWYLPIVEFQIHIPGNWSVGNIYQLPTAGRHKWVFDI